MRKRVQEGRKGDGLPPAQSPQKVVSKTMLLFLKCASMSQPEKVASELPHCDGSGLPLSTLSRLLPRGKNQTLIAPLVHSIAYTPPLPLLNPSP